MDELIVRGLIAVLFCVGCYLLFRHVVSQGVKSWISVFLTPLRMLRRSRELVHELNLELDNPDRLKDYESSHKGERSWVASQGNCKYCGKQIHSGARYCNYCGKENSRMEPS
jgi:hypothetical protein